MAKGVGTGTLVEVMMEEVWEFLESIESSAAPSTGEQSGRLQVASMIHMQSRWQKALPWTKCVEQ